MSFTKLSVLGKGSFGKVYKINDGGKERVYKEINAHELSFVETDVLLNIKSPHIISAYRIEDKGYVMDMMAGDMSKIKLTPKEVLSTFLQTADGLFCLHSQGILHLDVKPDNFLYNYDKNRILKVVVSDFGISKKVVDAFVPSKIGTRRFTRGYEPPEIINVTRIKDNFEDKGWGDSRSDLWALAVSILEIITKKMIIIDYYDSYQRKKDYIQDILISFNSRFHHNTKLTYNEIDNISRLLSEIFSPFSERMNTRDFMSDPFIQKYRAQQRCQHIKSKKYYVPYINNFTFDAIDDIRKKCMNYPISLFFHSIEIFFSIESVDHKLYSEEEERSAALTAFKLAKSEYEDYYIELDKHKIMKAAIDLNGEIGENRFYRDGNIVDLTILNEYIKKGSKILHFYNLIDPSTLFSTFRKMYPHLYEGGIRKSKEIKYKNLEDIKIKEIDPLTVYKGGKFVNMNPKVDFFRKSKFEKEVQEFSNLNDIFKASINIGKDRFKNESEMEYSDLENIKDVSFDKFDKLLGLREMIKNNNLSISKNELKVKDILLIKPLEHPTISIIILIYMINKFGKFKEIFLEPPLYLIYNMYLFSLI